MIYFENFKVWIAKQKTSEKYKLSIVNTLENIFNQDFRTIMDLKNLVNVAPNIKYKQLAVRTWIKFLEENEILPYETILEWKSKIKVNERSNVDSFVPTKRMIGDFSNKVMDYDYISYIFLRILLESGLRVIEGQVFIDNLNLEKFEVYENIAVYPLFHLRGKKSSFYIFISKETYNLISEFKIDLKKFNVEKLKTWIKRNKLLSLKYTRKYNFTLLISSGVSLEIANFIQGRASQNIGFNHYLAKKELALKEYGKILK